MQSAEHHCIDGVFPELPKWIPPSSIPILSNRDRDLSLIKIGGLLKFCVALSLNVHRRTFGGARVV